MNILVVGGAGYIGSHTCYALEHKGYTPIVYDNLSSGFRDFVKSFTFIQGELADTEHLCRVMKEYDIQGVLHFAAYISVRESVQEPLLYYQNNVCASMALLQAMKEACVRNLVISSTASVYGNPTACIQLTEDAPLAPISPYAWSKYMLETIASSCSQSFPLHVAALRYFNAAGADKAKRAGYRGSNPTHIIPRLFLAITEDIPYFSLYGTDYNTPDGTGVRDYIHVSDLATAHVQALEYLQREQKNITCNLGTNKGTSNRELIAMVESVTGKKVPVKEEARRVGDPSYVVADASKARSLLEWEVEHSDLANIVHTAWEWFMHDRGTVL